MQHAGYRDLFLAQADPEPLTATARAFFNVQIPASMGYAIIGVFTVLILVLLAWLWIQRRWIRIRAAVTLLLAISGVPVVKVLVKPYGLTIEVSGPEWLAVIATTAVALYLLYLELDFQRGRRGQRLFRDFRIVFEEVFIKERETQGISHRHGIPSDHVEMLLACMIWMQRQISRAEKEG